MASSSATSTSCKPCRARSSRDAAKPTSRMRSTSMGALAGLVLGQGDGELEYFVAAVAVQADVHRVHVDIDVFTDHFQQFVAKQRQVVRGAARAAFLRHDD